MKIVLLSLLLLLVITTDLACGAISITTRKMMVAEYKPNRVAGEQQNMVKGEAVAKSSATESKLEINNHHAIPRQSWDSSQNHGSNSDDENNGGGGSVNMIHP